MTSMIAKFVFGKVLKETAANKFGKDEDPYYEYPASELGKAGKKKSKRRKKALPPGLTEEEGAVLTKMKRRAYRLDMSFGSFLGIKFGWGSVIGIIPAFGDVADALLAILVVKTAMKLSLPSGVLIQMLFNVFLDFVIGLIPFLGDLIDAGYKCNTRNTVILEKHLREVGRKRLKEQGVTNFVDHSLEGGSDEHLDDIDLESQVARPERSRTNRSRRDDPIDDEIPTRTHSKSLKKTRR